jgi:hypothetical protein
LTAAPERPKNSRWPAIHAGILGLFIALVIAKLGNPVIFRSMEIPPANFLEFIFVTWPTPWGYFMLAAVALLSRQIF